MQPLVDIAKTSLPIKFHILLDCGWEYYFMCTVLLHTVMPLNLCN